MKKLLFVFWTIIFFSSCSVPLYTRQYFTTTSESVKDTVVDGRNIYRYEDSLIIIDYNLWSSGGMMAFKIYNKSEAPIYVNWKNSNFIFNSYNNQYWTDQVIIDANSVTIGKKETHDQTTIYSDIYVTNNSAVINTDSKYKSVTDFTSITNEVTTVIKENPSIQIPPRSYNVIHKFDLNMPLLRFDDTVSSVLYTYSKANSPLRFRNYLGISKDINFTDQIFIDNEFWLSSVDIPKNTDKDSDELKPIPSAFYIVNKGYVFDPKATESVYLGVTIVVAFVLLILVLAY